MKRISVLFISILLVALAGIANGGYEGKMNLNTATAEELSLVPGINDEMAQNIVQYRQASGPFTSLNELKNINGFYASSISELKCSLKLEGNSNFDLIDSSRDWCNKNNLE